MSDTKTFTVSLIGDSIAMCLESLFASIENETQQYGAKAKLNAKPKPGFRTPARLPKAEITRLSRLARRTAHLSKRQNRVAMLYSFIALEHITLEILNRLRNAADADFLARDVKIERKKGFWAENKDTGTVQMRDTKKAIIYLLNRDEIQKEACDCKNRAGSNKTSSFLTHGLKVRNTFVHGISGEKEVELTPVGDESVQQIDEKTTIKTQQMNAVTKTVSVTAYSAAIDQLKRDKIFHCGHADGDPNHICVTIALIYCLHALDLCQVLAKHYSISVSALFYMDVDTRVLVRNTTTKLAPDTCEKELSFSRQHIDALASKKLDIVKQLYDESR